MTVGQKLTWRKRLGLVGAPGEMETVSRWISSVVTDHLSSEVPSGKWVVIYDALPEEINLAEVMASHPNPQARFAVTRTPDEGYALSVHPVGGEMERHPYGYRQPRGDAAQVNDGDIGAVLVPALGFDRLGNRLGRGKGYYDRFLGRLASTGMSAPQFLGVAGERIVERLPTDSHDVAMTHLVLSTGVWPVPVPSDALCGVAIIG